MGKLILWAGGQADFSSGPAVDKLSFRIGGVSWQCASAGQDNAIASASEAVALADCVKTRKMHRLVRMGGLNDVKPNYTLCAQ
jgi:hypothetical protein